jgi:hypothetical protein
VAAFMLDDFKGVFEYAGHSFSNVYVMVFLMVG